MLLRRLFPAVVVAGAVCGPAAYFSGSQWWADAKKALAAKLSDNPALSCQNGMPSLKPSEVAATKSLLEGTPVRHVAEVLRFDVSTGWVMQRWPRVSTGLAELQLQGYRVPLVTGTAESDLAGALTYYFNTAQQVQQITFQGTTGNATKLIQLLSSRYHFTRRVANDPSLFLYEVPVDRGPAKSILQVRANGVVRSDQPNRRFDVSLVMERPEEK